MLRKGTSLQWTKQVLSLYSSGRCFTLPHLAAYLSGTTTPGSLYMYVFIAQRVMSMPPEERYGHEPGN